MNIFKLYIRAKNKWGIPYAVVLLWVISVVFSLVVMASEPDITFTFIISFGFMVASDLLIRLGDYRLSWLDYQSILVAPMSQWERLFAIMRSEVFHPKICFLIIPITSFIYLGMLKTMLLTFLLYLVYTAGVSLLFNIASRKIIFKRVTFLSMSIIFPPLMLIPQFSEKYNLHLSGYAIVLIVSLVLLITGVISFLFYSKMVRKHPFLTSAFHKKSIWY